MWWLLLSCTVEGSQPAPPTQMELEQFSLTVGEQVSIQGERGTIDPTGRGEGEDQDTLATSLGVP